MVGLGNNFHRHFCDCRFFALARKRSFRRRGTLWVIMLAMPFPFIANLAGWITAEVGRQPWLVYGMLRTSEGPSPLVSVGAAWFTLIGFMGLYTLLGILYLFLVYREIDRGPDAEVVASSASVI